MFIVCIFFVFFPYCICVIWRKCPRHKISPISIISFWSRDSHLQVSNNFFQRTSIAYKWANGFTPIVTDLFTCYIVDRDKSYSVCSLCSSDALFLNWTADLKRFSQDFAFRSKLSTEVKCATKNLDLRKFSSEKG